MLRLDSSRTVCFIALVSTLFVVRNTECATAPEPGDLRGVGKVTFPITCAADVQSDFARGVALQPQLSPNRAICAQQEPWIFQ